MIIQDSNIASSCLYCLNDMIDLMRVAADWPFSRLTRDIAKSQVRWFTKCTAKMYAERRVALRTQRETEKNREVSRRLHMMPGLYCWNVYSEAGPRQRERTRDSLDEAVQGDTEKRNLIADHRYVSFLAIIRNHTRKSVSTRTAQKSSNRRCLPARR
jgi:hypothetical protein